MVSLNDEDDSGPAATLREWSSLIGIVTAIVGNILISFALNIQRYAHIRLEKSQDLDDTEQDSEPSRISPKSYGTQQSHVANERAEANLKISDDGGSYRHGFTPHQDDADRFIPPQSSGVSVHSDSSSDITIKPWKNQTRATPNKKTYLKSPYWWCGIVLMTVGEAGNFLAYGFAPASIVSPLGVVALVSNCIIAPSLLKERFRQRDFWGVAVAVAGAVVIVLSAKTSEDKMGPDDVWAAITRWEFELYLGITSATVVFLLWASERYGDKTILIDLGLVGLFGGYTALSTKGVASLLSDTLWRALTFPITYLLAAVLVITALLQIRYVNRALQRFDSTQVIPVQFVLFTISVILGSAILYRDFESANADRVGKFIGGCAMTFLGVYLITGGRAGTKEGCKDMDGSDEEHEIDLVDEEQIQETSMSEAYKENRSRTDQSSSRSDSRRSSRQAGLSIPPILEHSPTMLSSMTSSRRSTASQVIVDSRPASPTRTSLVGQTLLQRPSGPEASVSSPLLPSQAQRAHKNSPTTTPVRPSTLSRRSIALLRPGPLMSPLSSSLSAVVADERRRAENTGSLRKRPIGPSSARKRSSRTGGGSSADLGSSPLKPSQAGDQAGTIEQISRPQPGRNVSAALGRLFRTKKGKDGKNPGNEHENDTTEHDEQV